MNYLIGNNKMKIEIQYEYFNQKIKIYTYIRGEKGINHKSKKSGQTWKNPLQQKWIS